MMVVTHCQSILEAAQTLEAGRPLNVTAVGADLAKMHNTRPMAQYSVMSYSRVWQRSWSLLM